MSKLYPISHKLIGEWIVFLSCVAAERHMMLSGIRMPQSLLSLTLHSRWDEWYEDSCGDQAY